MMRAWLATMSFKGRNLISGAYLKCCLYCLNIPESFLHVKIVSVLAWELETQTNS